SPSMLAAQGENSIMPSSSTGGTATGAGAGEGEALDAPSVSDTPEALGVACAPAPRVESDAASVAMLLRGADGFQCAIWSAAMAVPATASTVPNRSVCRCVMSAPSVQLQSGANDAHTKPAACEGACEP